MSGNHAQLKLVEDAPCATDDCAAAPGRIPAPPQISVRGCDLRTTIIGAGHRMAVLDISAHGLVAWKFLLVPDYVHKLAALFAQASRALKDAANPPADADLSLQVSPGGNGHDGHTKALQSIEYTGRFVPASEAEPLADFDTGREDFPQRIDPVLLASIPRVRAGNECSPEAPRGKSGRANKAPRIISDDEAASLFARYAAGETSLTDLAAEIRVLPSSLSQRLVRQFGERYRRCSRLWLKHHFRAPAERSQCIAAGMTARPLAAKPNGAIL